MIRLVGSTENPVAEVIEMMRTQIEAWERQGIGPICCFFARQRRYVGADDQKGYVDLSDYLLPNCPDEEIVIGCSRGCVSLSNVGPIYGLRLCEPCVKEAKHYLGDE
ncbi:hypothetical protein HYW21_02055 [Candidatus Woesearchaeota archaeon]|nr:hypothetical protein [Candidatus Woesearchaeota archaeon]